MSVLCADLANGSTHVGLVDGVAGRPGHPEHGRVGARWRVATDERRTPDEWAALLFALLGLQRSRVEGVAVCATVPGVLHAWREMLERYFDAVPHVVVGPGIRTGVPVLTDNPREVGADRITNAVAAAGRYGGPAIVVALGTATAFDVVDEAGRYVGGVIAPGVETSHKALTRHGAQLRDVELLRPRTVVAKNTVEALQSGMVFGFASLVDGLVDRIAAELGLPGDRLTVVATGHLAPVVVPECRRVNAHDPVLTLRGLHLIYGRNV